MFPFVLFPFRRRIVAWAILGLSLIGANSGRAVSVMPPDFTALVGQATQIVRVRITELSVRWDESPQGPVIHTYVKAETLKTLKGSDQTTISLRLLGGQIGDVSMQIADMPTFEVGQTYLLFIAGNHHAFCPLVGVMHGSYPLVVDPATQTERVTRGNGQPLARVDDVALPFIQSTHPAFRLSAGGGLTVGEFERAIQQELSRVSTH